MGSALAVTVMGVGALPAATAEAAGISTRTIAASPVPSGRSTDPAATSTAAGTPTVRYRLGPSGSLVRL